METTRLTTEQYSELVEAGLSTVQIVGAILITHDYSNEGPDITPGHIKSIVDDPDFRVHEGEREFFQDIMYDEIDAWGHEFPPYTRVEPDEVGIRCDFYHVEVTPEDAATILPKDVTDYPPYSSWVVSMPARQSGPAIPRTR